MEVGPDLVSKVKEHVKKRFEEKESTFGAERIDLRRIGHLKLEAKKRHFTFIVDEPPERGGTDEGPNPLAYFIAGAASCHMMQWASRAMSLGITIDELEMVARAHFDRGLNGAFKEIIYDLKVRSPDDKETILRLSRDAERMCFAYNTLTRAGVKMTTNITINGKPIG